MAAAVHAAWRWPSCTTCVFALDRDEPERVAAAALGACDVPRPFGVVPAPTPVDGDARDRVGVPEPGVVPRGFVLGADVSQPNDQTNTIVMFQEKTGDMLIGTFNKKTLMVQLTFCFCF